MPARVEHRRNMTIVRLSPEKQPEKRPPMSGAERKRKHREKRRAMGLCRWCGKRPRFNRHECRICAKARYLKAAKRKGGCHERHALPAAALAFAREVEGWGRTEKRSGSVLERLERRRARKKQDYFK